MSKIDIYADYILRYDDLEEYFKYFKRRFGQQFKNTDMYSIYLDLVEYARIDGVEININTCDEITAKLVDYYNLYDDKNIKTAKELNELRKQRLNKDIIFSC